MPLDDNTITNFFAAKAAAMSKGDINKTARCFAVPSVIYISDMVLHLDAFSKVRDTLSAYRENLLRYDYSLTRLDNLHACSLRNGNTKVSVTWSEMDTQDSVIVALQSNYYCKCVNGNRWIIKMLEIQSCMRDELLTGLDLI